MIWRNIPFVSLCCGDHHGFGFAATAATTRLACSKAREPGKPSKTWSPADITHYTARHTTNTIGSASATTYAAVQQHVECSPESILATRCSSSSREGVLFILAIKRLFSSRFVPLITATFPAKPCRTPSIGEMPLGNTGGATTGLQRPARCQAWRSLSIGTACSSSAHSSSVTHQASSTMNMLQKFLA